MRSSATELLEAAAVEDATGAAVVEGEEAGELATVVVTGTWAGCSGSAFSTSSTMGLVVVGTLSASDEGDDEDGLSVLRSVELTCTTGASVSMTSIGPDVTSTTGTGSFTGFTSSAISFSSLLDGTDCGVVSMGSSGTSELTTCAAVVGAGVVLVVVGACVVDGCVTAASVEETS